MEPDGAGFPDIPREVVEAYDCAAEIAGTLLTDLLTES